MKGESIIKMPAPERVSLPDRVAHIYYSHGLMCSSHPVIVLCLAIAVILLCSYPLLNFPLPGDVPILTTSPGFNFTLPENMTAFNGEPAIYIQQVVIKTSVSPWTKDLLVYDAFRSTLHQAFPLLEYIRNYEDENGVSLSNVCLHVEAVKVKSAEDRRKLLPQYNCLVLSPANLWQQSEMVFQQDTNLLSTVFNYHNFQKGKISLTELLLGVNLKESGLKRYPIRSRSRTIQFAVTLVLDKLHEGFLTGLRRKLESQYPLHLGPASRTEVGVAPGNGTTTVHVYFPGEFNIHEFLPLTTVYAVLFLYMYFSLRKVDLVKSKLGIAFCAFLTILACLCMSIGVCFFFGLTVSLNGQEMFPYLVAVVGLENVLVITKSVTSTPSHLDVKIRVAQGLSKEGWSFTKNLLIEITILTIGLSTLVSAIQELCILGLVGLVCDSFLQLCFFTTVLSIDIRRMEANYDNKSNLYYYSNPAQKVVPRTLMRSKSHHNLTTTHTQQTVPAASYVLAPSAPILNTLPKRLRLVHLWASTRFFQRTFMVAMVAWMCFMLYTAGFIRQILQIDEIAKFQEKLQDPGGPVLPTLETMHNYKTLPSFMKDEPHLHSKTSDAETPEVEDVTEEVNRLRHRDADPHRRLSLYHWPVMLSLYNLSLAGKHITILPSIRLCHVVSPDVALAMRNPNEKTEHFQWKTLAVALDPIDFTSSDENSKSSSLLEESSDRPFIPRSPMEIALASILVVVSILVLAYMTMVLYRCICSRNYAEWRSSWETPVANDGDTQVVLEAVAMSLEGHSQDIECLATDGLLIASSCLSGHIRIWNASDGDAVSQINRKKFFSASRRVLPSPGDMDLELNHSDYESGSPPSRGEPDLRHGRRKTSGDLCSFQFNSLLPLDESRKSLPNVYDEPSRKSLPLEDASKIVRRHSFKPNLNFSNLRLSDCQNRSSKGFDFGAVCQVLGGGDYVEGEVGGPSGVGAGSCSELAGDVPDFSRDYDSSVPPVWCLDCQDNLIAVGCSNGRIEVWDCLTGHFKCLFEDGSNIGVTSIKMADEFKVVAARLNGSLDLLQLNGHHHNLAGRQADWGFSSNRRTHVRTGSAGSALDWERGRDEMQCIKLGSLRAHQQPITVLDCENGRVVTGSQDHTLKVLRLEDTSLLYTLHGHCGPITCMFIDRVTPFLSGSGSQDGLLCVWDLLTGACIYSIEAHDGSITALTYSASYVISLGTDERLCVWERFLGHLLNTIQVMHTFCSSMVMVTHNLLITSRQGSLVLWDVRTGEPVRAVRLGHADHSVFVKQILHLGDSVVCDYGSQLRVVRFPIITDKTD